MLSWKICKFNGLSNQELYQLLKLRVDVFVVEQNCPYPDLDNYDLKEGVFHFPVWKHNSIVKSQNITAKIPNAMQLAAMYGQGVEVEATLGDTDSSLDSKGKAAGALVSTTLDRYNKNIDFAYKKTKPGEKKAGVPLPLTIRGETRKIGLDGADVLAIPTYRTWGGILGWSKEKKSFL